MMTYEETLEYLYSSTPVFERVGASAYKEGLSNTIALDEHFGHPHMKYRTIHVAGTNGKGSTSHSLAAIFQKAGYKVGLYTSPHLVDFAERIRINGKPIEHEYVVDFVENSKDFFEPLYPSFFEIITAMAFKYFADNEVDIAIIEVGLGGRLDCTNIITPILSVITNISFDHTGFLGDTLSKIAAEKAGIIKNNVPVVIGEWTEETLPVFQNKACECKTGLHLASTFYSKNKDFVDEMLETFELKGSYQKNNLCTILTAIEVLKEFDLLERFNIDKEKLSFALANVCKLTGLHGRWETIRTSPLVICDTGHNVNAWEYLGPQISNVTCESKRIVFGMVDDKDINTVMTYLPNDAIYYFCQASTHRAIPVEKVADIARAHNIAGETFDSVSDAYACALAESSEDDFVFVGGSSYVVADFLTAIN